MFVPPVWADLAARDGEVTLLVGRLRREAIYAQEPPFAAYSAAVKGGQLVGGHVPVTSL